ncbi:unnamed protein product [Arabidopsis lyrata]|nr:unnamed protein product [Arabidopsis lyrata]
MVLTAVDSVSVATPRKSVSLSTVKRPMVFMRSNHLVGFFKLSSFKIVMDLINVELFR